MFKNKNEVRPTPCNNVLDIFSELKETSVTPYNAKKNYVTKVTNDYFTM